jgi:hypothetical protein
MGSLLKLRRVENPYRVKVELGEARSGKKTERYDVMIMAVIHDINYHDNDCNHLGLSNSKDWRSNSLKAANN